MLVHKGTVKIETERLILRSFKESDAQDMFENWANDEEVTKYLTWPPHKNVHTSRAILADWINSYKKNEYYQWGIMFKDINQVIGSISVVHISNENEHCEIGYCIGRKFWGKGIMTEALRAIIKFLFSQVGFERIQTIHHSENVASGKVMKKAGMQYEGRKRHFLKNLAGVFVDCESYAIIREDLKE